MTPTITSGTAPLTRTGSYTITYAGSFSVTKGTQSAVTINSAATVPYGTSYTATATGGNGGGALSWALGSGSTVPGAAIDPATGGVTANSSGTVVFNVTRAGDTNYNPSATTANFTLTVNPQPITITLSGSKPYDTNTVATGASASITSGSLVAGDSIAYAYGALSSANANTYPVTTGLVVTPTVTSAVVPLPGRAATPSRTRAALRSPRSTSLQSRSRRPHRQRTARRTPQPRLAARAAEPSRGHLVSGSTASGAAIDSATGVVTANSTGTVVFNVYRAMDTNYNQSATTGNFTVTFTPRLITVTLSGSKPYNGQRLPLAHQPLLLRARWALEIRSDSPTERFRVPSPESTASRRPARDADHQQRHGSFEPRSEGDGEIPRGRGLVIVRAPWRDKRQRHRAISIGSNSNRSSRMLKSTPIAHVRAPLHRAASRGCMYACRVCVVEPRRLREIELQYVGSRKATASCGTLHPGRRTTASYGKSHHGPVVTG